MPLLISSIVMGSLMLAALVPEATGQVVSSNQYIHLVDANNPTGERDVYLQKVQNEMQDWRHKVHDFGERAKVKGQKEGIAAENELNTAWTKTETEAHKLQAAGAEGWDDARISYENALHRLTNAWGTIGREGK